MKARDILLGAAVLGVFGGGSFVAVDIAVEDVREESDRFEQTLSSLEVKTSKREQAYIAAVKALVDRRSKGDEPTIEEWVAVETTIDEARALSDSPLLQKLDRFIERMDATNKTVREDVFQDLKNHDVSN